MITNMVPCIFYSIIIWESVDFIVLHFHTRVLTLDDFFFLGKDVLAKARTGTGKTVAFLVSSLILCLHGGMLAC